jgi:tetratricopeptide (TPR) repeat protein
VVTGSGSRCSRVAAGTAWRLLRVRTFLMVNRG